MRYALVLSLLIAGVLIFCGGRPAHAAAPQFTMHIGGHNRTYLLHVPPRHDPHKSSALVVVLHGGGGNGRMMERVGFSDLADREDFLVAYPDGIEHNWNDGRQDVRAYAFKKNIDDVGFI